MRVSRIIGIILCLVSSSQIYSKTISGLVIKIADGDTLTVLTANKQQVRVRLAEIDAPEKRQDFGQKSKQNLSDLCYRETVRISYSKKDRYKRVIGYVYCRGVNVSEEQVKQGLAWVYDRYARDPKLYELQKEAKRNQSGLWSSPNPIPPWKYRRYR